MSFTRDAEKIDKKGRMKMSVGANIKKRRFELNMSQQDLQWDIRPGQQSPRSSLVKMM